MHVVMLEGQVSVWLAKLPCTAPSCLPACLPCYPAHPPHPPCQPCPPQVPDALLPDEVVEALVAERRPRFVALDGAELASSSSPAQPGHGGVVQLRLCNGIKVMRWLGGVGWEAGR